MSKVDTRVRHVTKPGANLFADLGFAPEEARLYQEQSRVLTSQTLTLKEQLMSELASWIEDHPKSAVQAGLRAEESAIR